MNPLPNDVARCDGGQCPSRKNCRRFTERHTGGERTPHAAFHHRREAGADACDSMIPVLVRSTYAAAEAVESEGGEL